VKKKRPSKARTDLSSNLRKRSFRAGARNRPPIPHTDNGTGVAVEGVIDTLTGWGATGWAWMPAAPDQTVQIEALIGRKVIGHALADQFRSDLSRLGKGTGRYGFTIVFDELLTELSEPTLRAIGPIGSMTLSERKVSAIEGHIDSLTPSGAVGWAWMPGAPETPVSIEALLDGKVIGRATANQMRADLASSGRGSGRYGFRLQYDKTLARDKKPELIVVGAAEPVLLRVADDLVPSDIDGDLSPPPLESTESENLRLRHIESIVRSGLLQTEWYLTQYADVAVHMLDPVEHYYDFGAAEGRRPNPYFNSQWYLSRNPELLESRLPPLVHYLLQGELDGKQPSLLFNPTWYRAQFNVPHGQLALSHYLEHCGDGTVSPIPEFDILHYSKRYPDVIRAGVDPFYHYIGTGYYEGRTPSEEFDKNWYASRYLDEDQTQNAFLHWLEHSNEPGVYGKMPKHEQIESEVAKIRQQGWLDETYYLNQNPDVAAAKVDPVWHYVVNGETEGRRPTQTFDPVFYLAANCDVRDAGINALAHFEEFGRFEGRLGAETRAERHHVPLDECVLFIGHDGVMAGAQVVLLSIIKWTFINTNRRILIILLGPGDLVPEYSKYGRILVVKDVEKDLALVRRFLSNESVSFIYANTVASGRFFSPAIRNVLGSTNIVAHIHELTKVIEEFEPEFQQLKVCTQKWICASELARDQLIARWQVPANDTVAIHAFITPAECPGEQLEPRRAAARLELGLSPDDFVIMGSGTVYSRKGPDIFVETAITAIADAGHRTAMKFIWIGDGKDREALEARVRVLSLSDTIKFFGFRRDANEVVAAADIFLLTSREDPFPLVCLEAARFAIPTLCVRGTTGITEFLRDDAGYVVGSAEPRELAAELARIVDDKAERQLRGRQAYERVLANHTTESALLKIERLLWSGISKPTVTVVVPNYNHEPFLPDRLDSIFSQTLRNIQIVLLDDASTDNSAAILRKRLSDPRVQLVVNDSNSGSVFSQWAKGLSIALGDYIWVAESDDSCEPNLLTALLSSTAGRDVAVAFAKTDIITGSGELVPEALSPYLGRFGRIKFDNDFVCGGADFVREGFAVLCAIVNASGAIFRRTLVAEALPEARTFVMCGDWFIYLYCMRFGEVAYTTTARNFFRRHSASTVHRVEGSDVYFSERLRIANYAAESFRISSRLVDRIIAELRRETDRFSGRYTFPADTFLSNLRTSLNSKRRSPGTLKIAFYIHGLRFSTGGIERLGSQIANYLCDRGYAVTIFCKPAGDRMPVYRLRSAITVSDADVATSSGQHVIAETLQAGSFDVFIPMLSEHLFANAIGAAQLAGVRTIASEHNDPWVIERNWWNRADRQKFFAMCDGVHLLLPAFKNSLNIDIRAKASIIPNGVDLNVFKPGRLAGRTKRIISAGRLCEQKGLDVLIDAFAIVAAEAPDWSLHIFGLGELEMPLRSQVSSLSLDNKVVFRGLSTQLQHEYASAEIFALPSVFEGFGIVIVEAMACGLPCVAFRDCNGPNVIIRDQIEGVLVENRSSIALAEALCRLIKSDDLRSSMRINASLRARDFDLRSVEREWERFICSIVG
jgi:glycosyltransferase involved in cell wall biosynthesis